MTTLKSVTVTLFLALLAPEELDRFIAADMKNWAKVIKDAHIPLE